MDNGGSTPKRTTEQLFKAFKTLKNEYERWKFIIDNKDNFNLPSVILYDDVITLDGPKNYSYTFFLSTDGVEPLLTAAGIRWEHFKWDPHHP